jgi:transposase
MPPRCSIIKLIRETKERSQGGIMKYYKDSRKFVEGKAVYCGVDVHLKGWSICFYCDGEVIEKVNIQAQYPILRHVLNAGYASARRIHVVYEAGFSGFWLYRRLTADGYDCIVTPPNRVPKTGNKVKTDRRDAQQLAQFLAAGLLKAIAVPSPRAEADRRLGRRRRQLVKEQTRSKNRIHSFLHLHGYTTPDEIGSCWSKAYMDWLSRLEFDYQSDSFVLDGLIRRYRSARDETADVTRQLRQLSRTPAYKENFQRITALRGVGLITAMTFLLELFDLPRFKRTTEFSSYLGLTPSQHSSGEHVRLGHITRQGNAYLRHVLIESAWTVIKHDPHLRAKYYRIRAQGTKANKAIVAVARSLAIRLRRCLLDGCEYAIGVC